MKDNWRKREISIVVSVDFWGEKEVLESQAKNSIKRGLLHAFKLVWDCGSTIGPEELAWDSKPAIDSKNFEIEEDVVSWVEG